LDCQDLLAHLVEMVAMELLEVPVLLEVQVHREILGQLVIQAHKVLPVLWVQLVLLEVEAAVAV
jgi:hypothetical protein